MNGPGSARSPPSFSSSPFVIRTPRTGTTGTSSTVSGASARAWAHQGPRAARTTGRLSGSPPTPGGGSPGGDLSLPKIGDVRVRWSRTLPSVPSTVSVVKDVAGRYFASFVVETRPDETLPEVAPEVGIDLGKPLHVRIWECGACEAVLDRDINAAVNVAKAAGPAVSACGARVRPGPVPAQRGETGTHRDGQKTVVGIPAPGRGAEVKAPATAAGRRPARRPR